VPGVAEAPDITGLRVLLLADLLARAAELRNLQVLTVLASDGQPAGQQAALERAADALGIHPAATHTSSGGAPASPGGPIDVHVAAYGGRLNDSESGLVVHVSAAHLRRAGEQSDAARDLLAGHEHDPLAVRLALMSFPSHEPADLTDSVLANARERLGLWRRRVAEWAELPSRPVPAHTAETFRAAFDDLDTVTALALLRRLELDDGVPAGAKFETFLSADRILGLGLPSEIGRPHG
jgi:hypothetical protein